MERRSIVVLEKDVYDSLVKESVKEYNSSKAISKVLNKIVRNALANRAMFSKILHSKRIVRTTAKEFEKFRHELADR